MIQTHGRPYPGHITDFRAEHSPPSTIMLAMIRAATTSGHNKQNDTDPDSVAMIEAPLANDVPIY